MWWCSATRSPSRKRPERGGFATVPAISWPKIRGPARSPFWIFFMSVPQMPQASTRTSISAGPASGTGTSSIRRSPAPRHTAAFMSKTRIV